MLTDAPLVAPIQHTQGEEQHAPALAYAALDDGGDAQVVGDLEPGKAHSKHSNHHGHGVVVEPLAAVVEQQIQHQEDDTGNQQSPEEPKCARQELIIAAHREDDVDQSLPELEPGVRVGDTAVPVAELLVHQADFEEQVVQDEEKQAPLDERHIQTLEPLHAEGPRVAQVLLVKEIACRNKEHRHVEQIDESHDEGGTLGMACAHQYDGDGLADRHGGVVAFHEQRFFIGFPSSR